MHQGVVGRGLLRDQPDHPIFLRDATLNHLVLRFQQLQGRVSMCIARVSVKVFNGSLSFNVCLEWRFMNLQKHHFLQRL